MRRVMSYLMAGLLVLQGAPVASRAAHTAQTESASLDDLIQQPYIQLFEQAPKLNLPSTALEEYRKRLEQEKEREEGKLEEKRDLIEDRIDQSQDRLKRLNRNTEETADVANSRHLLHCRIQKLRDVLSETKLALEKGLENTYDNKFAKLKVLEEWPQKYAEIQQQLETKGPYDRKFGDFRDIGFRNGTFEDQKDDIQKGREAIEEMKRQGILPPEVKDEEVVGYIRNLAQRIGRHSDLQVPLHISVLRSEEINAFALPGGFFFVNTGLILKAEKESELAGVMAHEIAHITARHGHRLMGKATIAQLIMQAAQIAAVVFTGGIGSIGAYYALQYGFMGLGLLLNLQLLGVSRDYEIEADILGTQYLWHAGYNTRGFISFFDKMAKEAGYVTGLSWFRTHPPFYQRMERTYEEITILPEKEDAVDDSSEFHAMQDRLKELVEELKDKDRDAPTLRRVYECDDVEIDLETELSEETAANTAAPGCPVMLTPAE